MGKREREEGGGLDNELMGTSIRLAAAAAAVGQPGNSSQMGKHNLRADGLVEVI